MRILKALLFFSLGLLVIGGAGFLIAREVLLIVAVSQVRASLNTLRRTATNTGSYVQACRQKGLTDDSVSAIDRLQLRFDSPTTYVLEVICNQFLLDPIVIFEEELPPFTKKAAGSSGIIYGEDLGGIGLEVWGRSRGITMQGKEIQYVPLVRTLGLPGPVTSCSGHGYTCCQAELAEGVGTVMTNVSDCPRSCYQSCVLRPLVLSVNTQPYFSDPAARQIEVRAGQPLEVAYVLDPQGSESLTVTVDFGDGTNETLTGFQGQASHVYACSQPSCRYQLTVQAVNEQGTQSMVTSISQVEIRVSR